MLLDEKLNVTQPCALAAQKSSGVLGSFPKQVQQGGKGLCPSACSALVRPSCRDVPSSGAAKKRRTWTCWPMKVIRGLGPFACEDMQSSGVVQPGEGKVLGRP